MKWLAGLQTVNSECMKGEGHPSRPSIVRYINLDKSLDLSVGRVIMPFSISRHVTSQMSCFHSLEGSSKVGAD